MKNNNLIIVERVDLKDVKVIYRKENISIMFGIIKQLSETSYGFVCHNSVPPIFSNDIELIANEIKNLELRYLKKLSC